MVVSYGLELAELQNPDIFSSPSLEVVMTVPSYFPYVQKRMLLDAVKLAGLATVSLVHENVAAALMLTPVDAEEVVMIYNMGAADTEVTVVRLTELE